MNKISKILFLFLSCIFISCSSSEDSSSSEIVDSNAVNSLELYMSSDEVTTGTTVLFTAFDNNGKNRTSDVKFYVDDNEIQGSSHIFNDPGEFNIFAKSATSGSLATFNKVVVPSARVAAIIKFSVPVTVTPSNLILAPCKFFADASI